MSSRIEKIETLVELAEAEEKKALETFSLLQTQYQQHLQQLETLQSYIAEYASPDMGTQHTIQLLSTHAFVGKLHSAIEQESSKTESMQTLMEKGREAWIEKRARLKALQNLLSKMVRNRQIKLDKQEQRLLDELSTQSHVRQHKKSS